MHTIPSINSRRCGCTAGETGLQPAAGLPRTMPVELLPPRQCPMPHGGGASPPRKPVWPWVAVAPDTAPTVIVSRHALFRSWPGHHTTRTLPRLAMTLWQLAPHSGVRLASGPGAGQQHVHWTNGPRIARHPSLVLCCSGETPPARQCGQLNCSGLRKTGPSRTDTSSSPGCSGSTRCRDRSINY